MKRSLREDQHQFVADVRETIGQKIKRIVLKAPTGYGKTIVAAHIIERAVAKGNRVTFVVDRIALIDQTVTKLYSEGIEDVGVIQRDHPMSNPARRVQVASIQTIHSRSAFPESSIVFIDECHVLHKAHKEWIESRSDLIFLGLSATPSTKGLGKYFQTMISAGTTREMIGRGILVEPRFFSCGHPHLRERLKKVKVTAGEYQQDQLSTLMRDHELTGDIVRNWLARWGRERGKTLCFAVDCAHARGLHMRFLEAGVRAEYQDGDTEADERRRIERGFASGSVEVVVNVGTLTTGTDWDVWCIIMGRPTKSEIFYQQVVGRGMRTNVEAGKKFCTVYDHGRIIQELGFSDDIECEHLDDGKPKGKTKPRVVYATECPKCQALRKPGKAKCEACGYAPVRQSEWQETDDQLIEVARGSIPKKGTKREWSEAERKAFYLELKGHAASKNYKPQWATAKYKARLKAWPERHWQYLPGTPATFATLQWIKSEMIRWVNSKPKAAVQNDLSAEAARLTGMR